MAACFNHDEDFIEWEAWGKFGLGLVGAAVVAGLWLSRGAMTNKEEAMMTARSRWTASRRKL